RPKGRGQRQIVRIRFHAEDRPNQPPTAILDSESRIIIPGFSIDFDASQSFDPEGDELTYAWDFGDGGTSTDVSTSHVYPSDDRPMTVHLTVSDGQDTGTAAVTLNACPFPAGNYRPGVAEITASGPLAQIPGSGALEFGAVAPGSSATLTFRVTNTEPDLVDPNDPSSVTPSLLVVCLADEGSAFTLTPSTSDQPLQLKAQESADITVTFAPTVAGHAAATLAVVTPKSTRQFAAFLAHGFGGSAPGPGPTQLAQPVLYTDVFGKVFGFLPNGTPINPNTDVYQCFVNGQNEGDICTTDADCAPNGGTCPHQGTCFGGDRNGQPCTTRGDCPNSQNGCSSASLFDPAEMCSDGAGGLYLLSDDGAFTDPNPSPSGDELGVDVARVTLDDNGNTTSIAIIDHTTSDTVHFACDGLAASDGGRVFLAEDHQLDLGNCFRSEEESLVTVRKSDGTNQTLLPRIDAVEGLSGCSDDIDNTTHLEVSSDGSQSFASFDSGGLWRLRPAPLQFLDSTYSEDFFRLHPDGSVVFVRLSNSNGTATINVFKVSPSQVATNALPVIALTPCGSFQLPNSTQANGSPGRSRLDGLWVGPPAAGSPDGTILVSVAASAVASDPLAVRATVAFASPANSSACSPIGVVNLVDMSVPISF
ncbi:MAG TPA: PKD domain-containing protein, partial [Acidimicrobiia bacterium]|nr:PKD domain-containing protein [Acidimicrobiia bacterium]